MSWENISIPVKILKPPKELEKPQVDRLWGLIRDAVEEIHQMNASSLSFEEIYWTCYSLVIGGKGDLLYERLIQIIGQHATKQADMISKISDEYFLVILNAKWQQFKLQHLMMQDIFMYLDQFYAKKKQKSPMFQLSMQQWREKVLLQENIKDRLLKMLLGLIHMERNSEVIDRVLMKSLIQMYLEVSNKELDFYVTEFEEKFLLTSARFYHVESQDFISSNTCSTYLKKVSLRLKEESFRVAHYLSKSTGPKLLKACEDENLKEHAKTLLSMESGCLEMIKRNKSDDLKLFYELFTRIEGGQDSIIEVLVDFVKTQGESVVKEETIKEKDPSDLISNVIGLRDRCEILLKKSFGNSPVLAKAINDSCVYFINLNDRLPEYLCSYLDRKLRMAFKGMSEEETNLAMVRVLQIVRFLKNKDVFKKFYEHFLAKRLLSGRAISEELERLMISKIKQSCGQQFTSKMEGMFLDMKLSNETIDGFKNYLSTSGSLEKLPSVDVNVRVLTQGFWPTLPAQKALLGEVLNSYCNIFTEYYLSAHNGRKLLWQYNIGTAEIQAQIGSRKYILVMSTYQMLALLLFNSSERLSFKTILQSTQIPAYDLMRALQAMSLGKIKILKKSSRGKEINDDDIFTINRKFRSKLRRVKILAVLKSETEPERNRTREKIDEDRRLLVDAAIVRTMKARKVLMHNDLIIEVIKQLKSRFTPKTSLIKMRIENLIDRDYLERFENERRKYKYKA
ncbi:cullin-3a-related [Anaeramoeba flamelloides]|uniref:Cullin-3a-related n=1 Tax=Anaeramoeba flamelloides TaxID=1746091 RepID=A0AAV8A288_9EUKA|nr:cullin-3a-related [Anaeramoeba flamelloides]KAJ6228678.1 cullin-3a-related [Anaeramoeba flamelloides]